jgi:hypothetical protein
MPRCPAIQGTVVFELPGRHWQMTRFDYKLHDQPFRRKLRHDEPDRIRIALGRQPRTRVRISQIAGLEFLFAKLDQFKAGYATSSTPCRPKWQTRGMR